MEGKYAYLHYLFLALTIAVILYASFRTYQRLEKSRDWPLIKARVVGRVPHAGEGDYYSFHVSYEFASVSHTSAVNETDYDLGKIGDTLNIRISPADPDTIYAWKRDQQ